MIKRKTWTEFRDCGLLWWINRILHTFGWSIVYEVDSNSEKNEVIDVYPARVKFRGFSEKTETKEFIEITKYMKENADELLKEATE